MLYYQSFDFRFDLGKQLTIVRLRREKVHRGKQGSLSSSQIVIDFFFKLLSPLNKRPRGAISKYILDLLEVLFIRFAYFLHIKFRLRSRKESSRSGCLYRKKTLQGNGER